MTPEQLEARRAYHRKRYAKKKAEGTLPKDRYTKEQRAEYNKKWRENNPNYFVEKKKKDGILQTQEVETDR